MTSASFAEQTTPLIGDKKRQAVDSILGYDYQIWRTVEAWMLLNPDEILYIECAEDFDVAGAAGVSMVQVKNSPKSITINSSDVLDAIQNFWIAKSKNSNRGKIILRFLTRGEIGHEREREFGEKKGLELWDAAATGNVDAATSLASHLANSLSDAPLVTFLKAADARILIDELFSRIEWIVGEPGIEAVQIAVRRLAIQRGASLSPAIPAQVAADAVHAILAKCREVAVLKDPQLRNLTAQDLQLVFGQSTSLPLPITGNILAMLGAMVGPKNSAPSLFVSAVANELPALQQPYLPRFEFIQTVIQILSESLAVLIVGSEGRGKTTVASIVGHKITGLTHWVDLSANSDEQSVALAIENALMKVRGVKPPQCIILDDLPVAQGMPDQVWRVLRALIESCRQVKSVILLTAKGVEEEAVDSRFRTVRVKALSVPVLTEAEVEHFFADLGCPADRLANWAKISLMQSGNGHPKLVYLHGLELQDSGWPQVTSEAFIAAPTSILEARTHARQVAAKAVRDVDRPFLYTLSVAMIPFDRSVALAVGSDLELDAPGESFDRLAGRWIEQRGSGRYSVTTMLNGQAQKIWADDKICKAHQILFDAFVNRETINSSEAWAVFLHAYCGKDPERLKSILGMLVCEDFSQVPQFAEQLEPLLFIGSKGTTPAIPFDPECSVLLRLVQFRIAKVCYLEKLIDIAERWSTEIERLPDEEKKASNKVIRGVSIACAIDADLPLSMVIEALKDAAELTKLSIFDTISTPLIDETDKNIPVVAWLFAAVQAQCHSAERLDQFFLALDRLENDFRNQLLQEFDGPYAHSNVSMIERAWLGELKSERKDWHVFIVILEKAVSLTKKWNSNSLRAVLLATLSLVYDEQLNDGEKALQILRESDLHGYSDILAGQEANVLFRREQFESALCLWRKALHTKHEANGRVLKLRNRFSMRSAGISAANLELFEEAANWFQLAAKEAAREPAGVPAAAFQLDAAYCWFKHRDGCKMLEALTAAAMALKGNYDRESEFFEFAAQKNLGNLALWLQGQFQGIYKGGSEPSFGSCSNPDLTREGYQSLPQGSYAIPFFMILDVAKRIGIETIGTTELSSNLEVETNAIAAFQFRIIKLEQAIAHGKLHDIAILVHDLQVVLFRSMNAMKSDTDHLVVLSQEIRSDLPIDKVVEWIFLLGLVLKTVTKGSIESLSEDWASQLNGRLRAEDFKTRLQNIVANFILNDNAALEKMRKSPADISNIAAAARFLVGNHRHPRDTLFAQAALLLWLQGSPVQKFLKFSLEQIFFSFTNNWRQHILTPALLITPRTTIPMIEAAIHSSAPIPKRMLELFRAASLACGGKIPPELVDFLEKSSNERSVVEAFLAKR